MVSNAHNSSNQEAKAGVLQVQDQPELCSETLSWKKERVPKYNLESL
jgi:hypothetical protein